MNFINKRLDKIENKLGGTKKITCNEKDTIERVRQSVVRIIGGESEGSGFAIKENGLILTNFHVIQFEPSPKVVLPDNTFQTAEIIMADKNSDLAIIKIKRDLPVISWGEPSELDPAEELLAIGFPLGGILKGEASVNKGSLSGRRRSKDVGVEYLQTDTTLTQGVSGGPMTNICGEVVAINTAGLSGLGLGISADSIKQKWLEMATAKDSLKDVHKITFEPDKSPLEAVRAFYNYLKARKLEKAFELLSDNFKKGYSFDNWKKGYEPLLDTTVIKIDDDKENENRVNIKLSTKDMVSDEIVYKYFEGYWDVKSADGKWLLWDPEIKEVIKPDFFWFYE
ncbi:trypsin-like peptidase domain-containing protein [Candidatus Gottesmanbacteria bacterium]|nr:trypsin-like peptidase domain-containing protein [Candidatus Gottesmanbacteria bacterium]